LEKFTVKTHARTEMLDITSQVRRAVEALKLKDGAVIVYVPHTTAGVAINENADPSVREDILMELDKIVPLNDNYRHGEGNSAAHIKASLVGTSQMVIVECGGMALGRWQGIFLCEFDGPRSREVWVKAIGK
jgi:secondary thiamine-phosphate synthase enzyme